MNAAVRAVVRMGIYVGCKVYLIKEVSINNYLQFSYFGRTQTDCMYNLAKPEIRTFKIIK